MSEKMRFSFTYLNHEIVMDNEKYPSENWYIEVGGQAYMFKTPNEARYFVDKIRAYEPLIGQTIFSLNYREQGVIDKHTVASVYYHNDDDGARFSGVFLKSTTGEIIDPDDETCLSPEGLAILEKIAAREKLRRELGMEITKLRQEAREYMVYKR